MKPDHSAPIDLELRFQNSGEAFWAGIASGALMQFIKMTNDVPGGLDETNRLSIESVVDEHGNYLNVFCIRDQDKIYVMQVRELEVNINEVREKLCNILKELG